MTRGSAPGGGMVTGQIDTCITVSLCSIFIPFNTLSRRRGMPYLVFTESGRIVRELSRTLR